MMRIKILYLIAQIYNKINLQPCRYLISSIHSFLYFTIISNLSNNISVYNISIAFTYNLKLYSHF
jgi:hypothetical protein